MPSIIEVLSRTLVHTLLATFVLAVLLSVSILSHFNNENYHLLLGSIAFDLYEQNAIDQGQDPLDLDEAYFSLSPICDEKDNIVIDTLDPAVEISCQDFEAEGQAGFSRTIKEEMGIQVEQVLEEELEIRNIKVLGIKIQSFEAIFSILKSLRLWLSIGAIALAVAAFFLYKPRYKGITHLGWSGISLGFPFIFVKQLPLPDSIKNIPTLAVLTDSILGTFATFLLIVFLIGSLLLISGLVWRHYYNKKKKSLYMRKR